MISRRATKTMAQLFDLLFSGHYTGGYYGGKPTYRLHREDLHDFLYEREYEPWFLHIIKKLNCDSSRGLKECLMGIHTGESAAGATPGWPWEERRKYGQQLLRSLCRDILLHAKVVHKPERYYADRKKDPGLLAKQLERELELDGYLLRDGQLLYSEAAVVDTEEEQSILIHLMQQVELSKVEEVEHHLKLSDEHYSQGRWGDAIANARHVLESVLRQAAMKLEILRTGTDLQPSVTTSPKDVRYYLEKQGLLEKKETEAIAKNYGLLSEIGGHPNMAERDQARLMRHLALILSQFVLLRLQAAIGQTSTEIPSAQ